MKAADGARRRAYAPYSRFPVGAALLLRDGRIVTGCNVENASYGLAVCAERNAVFKAVSEGDRDFVAIAVTAREGRGAPPCGSCRQVLHEFAPDIRVYWRDARGRMVHRPLGVLLAMPFDLEMLKGKR
jgi:cytidine deaminase